jgi:acetyl-CoA acetyltransferase
LSASAKYAIVGVGETPYRRFKPDNAPTTLELATHAIRAAAADAGLATSDIDCLMSYHLGDSTETAVVAGHLGLTLNYFLDMTGGGSSIETLITAATGLLEVGACHTVCIYRSLLGYAGRRFGLGSSAATIANGMASVYGVISPAQRFAPVFSRYMTESGLTSYEVAHIKAAQSAHARANPKALYPHEVTVADVLSSRWIVQPVLHLYDCCVESDSATAIIITSLERALNLRQHPIVILASLGRVSRLNPMYFYNGAITDIGAVRARQTIFGLAGVTHDDIDLTGAYDAFTFTSALLLDKFGFCPPEGIGSYLTSGIINLGGRRPNNTSGGQLCEGYTHGSSLVIENVRQLRWTVDDYCPGAANAQHTYDYDAGGCRQVSNARISMNMGWATPATQTALILARH